VEATFSGERPAEFTRNVAFVEAVRATPSLVVPHTAAKAAGTEKVVAALATAVGCTVWLGPLLTADAQLESSSSAIARARIATV